MCRNAEIFITVIKFRFSAPKTHFWKYEWRNSQAEPGGDGATSSGVTLTGRREGTTRAK